MGVRLSRESLERLAGRHPAKPYDVALNERLHRRFLDAARVVQVASEGCRLQRIGSLEEETVAQRQSIHTANVPASAKVDEPSQREEAVSEVGQRDGAGVAKARQRVGEGVVRRQLRHARGCTLRARQRDVARWRETAVLLKVRLHDILQALGLQIDRILTALRLHDVHGV